MNNINMQGFLYTLFRPRDMLQILRFQFHHSVWDSRNVWRLRHLNPHYTPQHHWDAPAPGSLYSDCGGVPGGGTG